MLNELLDAIDRASANLAKLEAVWNRAEPFLPTGPQFGSAPEYEDLQRTWTDLLHGLPPVDGWTITEPLPGTDEIGRGYLDYWEIGETPTVLWEAAERPGRDIAEYRFRLHRARRRAVRERLQALTAIIDAALPRMLADVERGSNDELQGEGATTIREAIEEIERLMGDATARQGRWSDLHRHLRFSQGHDWHDILEFDWPTVKPDIEAASFADTEPLPVPDSDLGTAAAANPAGSVTTALHWENLDDTGFERLLYDLLRALPGHENVQWLMNTRAADRGRDLSLERLIQDGSGAVRVERVIVQAKHWLSRSVRATDISDTLTNIKLWQPPVVRGLVIATSGRFTSDAVSWAEQHNESGAAPFIDLWPDSKLESLLSQHPHLVVAHGLR